LLGVLQSSNPCIAVYDLTGGIGITNGSLDTEGRVPVAPTSPTRLGYTFAGWSATNGGSSISFPYGVSGSANLTIYAKWVGNVNTVTYDSNGGSAVANGSFISGGQIAAAPTSPTRERFTFTGWLDRGEAVNFPYTPTAVTNITLYAGWEYNETETPTTPVVKPTTKPTTKPTVKPTPTIKAKTSSVPKFSAGASSLSKSGKTAVQKIVKNSGADATYTIIGEAGKSNGVPARFVKALAMARAEKVKAYLIKLGVKKSNISIKLNIVKHGKTPKTKILANKLALK
jgi:uncharacterized repeat protein (TIGR02543 family)